jgi:putative addiction module component (TIGR02574 family)
MSEGALDKQINNYLVQSNVKQKKAVLTVVKTFAEEHRPNYSPWNEEGLITELDKRMEELESGKEKGYTWEEVKQRARQSLKAKIGE